MDPPTSVSKGSEQYPEPKRSKTTPKKLILEALKEDGSIDMELLKGISRGCLEVLQERHAKGKFLGNIRPAQIFYRVIDGKIKIEFQEPDIVPTLNDYRISELMWMAPEMLKKNSKPTADSDVFTLGLLFYFMLTKRGSPLVITSAFLNCEFHHKVKIDLKLLDRFRTDTDTILFIDLIKRMIKKDPNQRETCENLIDHAALKSHKGRVEIVQHLADKCFYFKIFCFNEYLVKMMNKKEVHMEGSLGEDSDSWKDLLAEVAKLPKNSDPKLMGLLTEKTNLQKNQPGIACSRLLNIFKNDKRHKLIDMSADERSLFDKYCLKYFQISTAALPNFFPHLYNIYREELPKMEERPFKEIFEHFDDQANLLGTGSNHTRVYRGKFGLREIAIKRVLKTVSKAVEREISIMLQTDRHANILKYFAKEEDKNFIYIGTELCEGNLATFIKDSALRQKMAIKSILQQTAEGLNHLHQLSIIHCDVKPENILIFNDNGTYSVKLADFGIAKPLNAETILSTVNMNIPGTVAWIAPEVGEKEHAKSSDVFSLGCVFYFVIFDGIILWQELGMNYKDVAMKLEAKLQLFNDQGDNKQFLQMDLLMRMLNLKPELRPSVQKVLYHPLFWADKKSLEFILEIRKKFDVLDPKFLRKIKNEHQKVLRETPIVQRLKVALDLDKSVVSYDWKVTLDATLEEEFKGDYDKESVSDLLKAMRNKWMHKIELKDAIKALFGGFTESEYINYFTSKFPKLLVHCYNAVENEAKDLLAEYFYQDVSAQAPTAVIDIRCLRLEGSKLAINCHDVITFPETKIEFCSLKVEVISHLFIEENKSFTNFLQRNASNVTHLEFLLGSLKFDSVDKILQKLPKLKEIQFSHLEYEASKTNQTIQTNTCQNLVELKIWGSASSKLLQAFQECQTIKNLTVKDSKVTLEEILHKYASLEELFILVNNNYPVSHQNEANSTIHQLKVLKISLLTKDEKILEKVMTCILKQNNLQQFSFGSNNCNPSQSLCKQLAAHICQLKHLRNLVIYEKLFEEVEAFVANCRITNTRLEELACQLNYFKLLPSSLLGHFTNLRKLDINCYNAEEIKVKDLFNFLNRTQMTSIRLEWLSPTYFQLLKKLQVQSLQVLEIQIRNEPQDKVPAFDILQEFLPRHPNITEFEIKFYNDYDELKSLELIPMIVGTLTKLERLGIGRYSKITPAAIEQIVALKTLKSWKINRYESQIFYKT